MRVNTIFGASLLMASSPSNAFSNFHLRNIKQQTQLPTAIYSSSAATFGKRISIDENFEGTVRIRSNPDIYVIKDFLTTQQCEDMIQRAKEKTLQQSPVAYAGRTQDFKDLVELAAKGPVAWVALAGAWLQLKDDPSANQFIFVTHSLQNYAGAFVVATALIALFTTFRAESLKALRTSTSTTLDDLRDASSGTAQFVKKAAQLFDGNANSLQQEAMLFEAPTVIRYEPEQVLAPHYDANPSADIEDANRGGQTLATLIVYLNDVNSGGLTRFGRLPALSDSEEVAEQKLTVRPKQGDAILFFPADSDGKMDERLEHEGCPAIDEKWIARIWRHKARVPPPFGLSEEALRTL
mmetsp:Transcript_8211/g.12609  ORF Transcript_8211/g.12609 Transcript_8211/m.12609 type:complete len:352 (+) Transcript_8211:121-1176(+)